MKMLVVSLLVMSYLMVGEVISGRAAAAVTLDFETLGDMDVVTTQFAGLTFGHTVSLASGAVGGTLNELEFPPHSGVTIVMDVGGAITIAFDTPVSAASGFFTYAAPVTITAFDTLLVPVATATSAFGANALVSGDAGSAPNELIQVAFAGGISSLTLEGDPTGFSFTLDDFTFIPRVVLAKEEPPTPALLVLVTAALIAVAGWRRRGPRSTGRRVPAAY